MGARMSLELARRGHRGNVVALDPGGFWTDRQVKLFGATVGPSIALVRRIQPLLPALTASPVGRTALLLQFSAKPWRLPSDLVLQELRNFAGSPSLDEALAAMGRFAHWNIASSEQLSRLEGQNVQFSFEIDAKQLPRPFLIGQAGNADWTLSTSVLEPIPAKPQP